MKNKFNPYHLISARPWPILTSNFILSLLITRLILINKKILRGVLISFMIVVIIAYSWWKNVHQESSCQGDHSFLVINGLKIGIILFISSEILFFSSFFWSFFHSRISPTLEIGVNWPPFLITPFNPISIPLLNTILLLSSGISVTWAHHSIIKGNFKNSKNSLILTIILGVVFSLFQGLEYKEAPFCISDSTFGTTFFISTGFHGIHVLIGTSFLMITLKRFNNLINSPAHIVGFECAAWYWHFVDVVWLFLYRMIYWWGAYSYKYSVHLICQVKKIKRKLK